MERASWIWAEGADGPNTYVEFRGSYRHEGGAAVIRISASQEYRLYVDGALIGQGPSPCTPEWQYFDTYALPEPLAPGLHQIAAVVYHFGEPDIVISQMQAPGGLWVSVSGEDGTERYGTDDTWRCRISPRWETRNNRISRWGGFNEIYVADREDGWERPDYDDSGWGYARIAGRTGDEGVAWQRLIPAEIGPLHREPVMPEAVVRAETNYGSVTGELSLLRTAAQDAGLLLDSSKPYSLPSVVYDFGREVVGYPELVVEAPEGGVIRLAYGESLELQEVDTFVLRKGTNRLRPFGRRACRYLKLASLASPSPVLVSGLVWERQHYAFRQEGYWRSSDDRLNGIWEVSRYTTLMNSHDHLEDCPWRERALWVADAVVMGKVIYHVFGDTALLRKCLLQGARIQREDGMIPGTGPERNDMLLPDFCGHWLLGVRDYWRYSGDTDTVRELWPAVQRLLEWFAAQKDDTGLFAGADRKGWFCFIDWTAHIDKRDKVAAISLLYYAALEAAASMADGIGKADAASQYRADAARLRTAVRSRLWLPDRGAFSDCMAGSEVSLHLSLQTNFLAAWCGLMDDSEIRAFIERYYDTGELVDIKGAFFQHIVLEVFVRLGMTGRALQLISGYWGAMLDRGATTWWETFDATTPFCVTPSTYAGNVPTYLWEGPLVSQCHAWGASPAYLLHHLITGIDVLELGSGIVKLRRPAAEGPASLQAGIPTPYGMIQADWTAANGEPAGTIRIPPGIRAVCLEDLPPGLHIIQEETIAT